MPRVTHRDIAARVGVDRSTVSRVLNHKAAEGGISPVLAERIARAAAELGYLPNTAALAVRMGRFNGVSLLMSADPLTSYLPTRLLDGIHDELAAHDLHLTVSRIPDEQLEKDDYVPKILRTHMSDGLLINYTHHLPTHLEELVAGRNLPAVWINRRLPHDAVYAMSYEAARDATRKLIGLGHKRIVYLDLCHASQEVVEQEHHSVADRLRGYTEAMKEAGLTPVERRPDRPPGPVQDEIEFIAAVLRDPDRPTALLCYFVNFLYPLLRVTGELGIQMPRDLSVICFAPEEYRDHGVISAMIEPHYAMGQEAARMLRGKIAKPTKKQESVGMAFEWMDLGTCGRPAGAD